MKLTFTKEFEIADADVNISLDLKKETFAITLSYTCPSCAGHGCRHSGDRACNNGSISMKLDPDKMDKNLDKETANHLRETVRNLAAAIK